jgi:hypothetical protein
VEIRVRIAARPSSLRTKLSLVQLRSDEDHYPRRMASEANQVSELSTGVAGPGPRFGPSPSLLLPIVRLGRFESMYTSNWARAALPPRPTSAVFSHGRLAGDLACCRRSQRQHRALVTVEP